MSQLVTLEDLKKATGHKWPGQIEECLKKQGILVIHGKKGRIFTTIDAINQQLGVTEKTDEDKQSIEFI